MALRSDAAGVPALTRGGSPSSISEPACFENRTHVTTEPSRSSDAGTRRVDRCPLSVNWPAIEILFPIPYFLHCGE